MDRTYIHIALSDVPGIIEARVCDSRTDKPIVSKRFASHDKASNWANEVKLAFEVSK